MPVFNRPPGSIGDRFTGLIKARLFCALRGTSAATRESNSYTAAALWVWSTRISRPVQPPQLVDDNAVLLALLSPVFSSSEFIRSVICHCSVLYLVVTARNSVFCRRTPWIHNACNDKIFRLLRSTMNVLHTVFHLVLGEDNSESNHQETLITCTGGSFYHCIRKQIQDVGYKFLSMYACCNFRKVLFSTSLPTVAKQRQAKWHLVI